MVAGRLAACFIDSSPPLACRRSVTASSTSTASSSRNSTRTASRSTPDYWLANEEPWGHIDYNRDQKVSFGGEVVERTARRSGSRLGPCAPSGRLHGSGLRLRPCEHPASVDRQELRRVRSAHLQQVRVLDAVKPQVEAENISKILYPEDPPRRARLLRSSSSTSSCPPPSTTPSASSTRARTSRI